MNFIKGFFIGFIYVIIMFFVIIPSLCMDDTNSNPITLERIQAFYKGE